MTQEFLHASDVGAAIQEVRGERMAKRMRAGTTVETGFLEVLFEHPRNAARGDPRAEAVGEDRRVAAYPASCSAETKPLCSPTVILAGSGQAPSSSLKYSASAVRSSR